MTDRSVDPLDEPAPDAVPPRLAATLIVVRSDPFEVLMVRRPDRGVFPGVFVFPGGAVEAQDHDPEWRPRTLSDDLDDLDHALRIAAIRECFEETGLLAARTDGAALATGAHADFRSLVDASGGRLELGALTPFAHWITPISEKRRFDTHFYLVADPGDEAIVPSEEIMEVRWVRPAEAVEAAQAGEFRLMFPTLANLDRLARSGSLEAAVAAATANPPVTVNPVITATPEGMRLTIPVEAGYPISELTVQLERGQ